MIKIGIISGSFDLLHFGHIEYLNEASHRFDTVIPIINTTPWVNRWKQRRNYLDEDAIRKGILGAYPNFIFPKGCFHGALNRSVSDTLKDMVNYGRAIGSTDITFFKMKDRGRGNCPEERACYKLGIKFEHLEGKVKQHTSELYRKFEKRIIRHGLKEWESYKEEESSSVR